MVRFLFAAGICVTVSACTTTPNSRITADQLAQTGIAISHTECQGSARANCAFLNGPVQLKQTGVKLASRKATFFPTISQLDFVDARATRWVAPKDTLTDGASIPDIFVSLIGNPTSAEFLNASTLHDAYCGIGNENGARFHADNWQNVHRMFYDALRVGGTSSTKAKIMFAAVYLGGPRWASTVVTPSSSSEALGFQGGPLGRTTPSTTRRSLGLVSTSQMVAQLRSAIDFIKNSNPSLAELELFLTKSEARAIAGSGDGDGGHFANSGGSTTSPGTNPTTGGTLAP